MKKNYFYAIIFVFFICRKPASFFSAEVENKIKNADEISIQNEKSAKSEKPPEKFFSAKNPDFKKDFSLTFYGDNKKVFAADLKTSLSQMKFSFCENDFNFGISAFSYNFLPSFPFVLKAGNLSESGSLSKLKSLALSGGNSPFSVDFSGAGGIYSGLPSYASFSKPTSAFSEIGFSDKSGKNIFLKDLKFNCFYSPEKENFAFSFLSKSAFLKNKIKTAFSVTSGFFSYEERSDSAWFSDDLFFPKGKHLCSIYQADFEIPSYKTAFSLGSYENPFGRISNVYRWDNYFSSKYSNFSFSAYYNPNSKKDEVLSASGNVLKDSLQFRTTFVRKIRLKTGFLRNGILATSKTGLSENFSDLKFSLGSQFSSLSYSLGFYAASNFKIAKEKNAGAEWELENICANFSGGRRFAVLSPALSANVNFYFSDNCRTVNSTSKIAAKLYFQKNPKINAESSYSFSVKSGEISSRNINFSVYSKFSAKQVNFLCNLGWKAEL